MANLLFACIVLIVCFLIILYLSAKLDATEKAEIVLKSMCSKLSKDIETKDAVIIQQQEILSEKGENIKALQQRIENSRNTIEWYQQRTKIGEYFIDDFVNKAVNKDKPKKVKHE